MKKLKFLAVALAVLTMASCSKEVVNNNEEPINGEKNVTVTLDMSSSTPSTRANDNPQLAANKTTIHDGMCYFLDTASNVVKQFPVDTAIIKTGQQFAGVPSSAKKFYLVANVKASGETYPTPALGTKLDDLMKLIVIEASSQNKAGVGNKSTTDKVVMEGISGTFSGTAPNMSGSAVIKPIMARIEIDKITLKNVTSATLEGIFINNIYTSIDLIGTKLPAIPLKETDATKFDGTFTAGMFDYSDAGIGDRDNTKSVMTPGTGKTWAYQVIPSANVGTDDKLPHIVIKLKDVEAPNQPTQATAFATVMKYVRGANATVTSFERSTYYKITNIEIDYPKIDTNPETQTINVTATVEVSPWLLNTITPEL